MIQLWLRHLRRGRLCAWRNVYRSLSLDVLTQASACCRLHEMGIAEPVAFRSLLNELQASQRDGGVSLVALQGGQPLRDVAQSASSSMVASNRCRAPDYVIQATLPMQMQTAALHTIHHPSVFKQNDWSRREQGMERRSSSIFRAPLTATFCLKPGPCSKRFAGSIYHLD